MSGPDKNSINRLSKSVKFVENFNAQNAQSQKEGNKNKTWQNGFVALLTSETAVAGVYNWEKVKPDSAGGFASYTTAITGSDAYHTNGYEGLPTGDTYVWMWFSGYDGGTTPIYNFGSDIVSITISGDETWINVTNPGGDASYLISHGGPSTETNTVVLSGDTWITPDATTIGFDAKGHFSDASNIDINIIHEPSADPDLAFDSVNDVDLAYGTNMLAFMIDSIETDTAGHVDSHLSDVTTKTVEFIGDDAWTDVVSNAVANGLQLKFTHEDPQSESTSLQCVISLSVVGTTSKSLRISAKPISVDAKGHTITLGTAANVDLALTSVTNVTDFQVDASAKKLQIKTQEQFVLAAGTESSWTDVHEGGGCS